MGKFLTIAITAELPSENEAKHIELLLQSGAIDRVHLRHPHLGADGLRTILNEIGPTLHNRISLHDHFELCTEYSVGIHLNSRNSTPPHGFSGICSRSCHKLSELEQADDKTAYCTLSPIYDSISKEGYHSRFDLNDSRLRELLRERCVIALGGVTPDKFGELSEAGFCGAAMLGYCLTTDAQTIRERIQKIKTERNKICCNS